MSKKQRRWLKWSPRLLSILFAAFLSLFSLDVFGVYDTLSETLAALFMHQIPVYLLLAALWLAWNHPVAGGTAFLGLGVLSVLFFNTLADMVSFAIVSLPLYLIGALFLWSGIANQRPRQRQLS